MPPSELMGSGQADVNAVFLRTMNTRMDRMETEFVDSLRKMDSRLEQVVNLMRDVASLQQQYIAQGETLTELRNSLKDQTVRFESSLTRVHQRLDEVTLTMNTTLDLETTKIVRKLGDYEREQKELSQKFHTWLNRGLGGWAMFTLIIAGLQVAGKTWLDNMDAERVATADKLTKVSSRMAELENRMIVLEEIQQGTPADHRPR